jgi:hypothetical protein
MGITLRLGVEVVMAKSAAQLRVVGGAAATPEERVIDIRTRKPWRPPEPRRRIFLFDVALVLTLVTLGAWLFIKMQGG